MCVYCVCVFSLGIWHPVISVPCQRVARLHQITHGTSWDGRHESHLRPADGKVETGREIKSDQVVITIYYTVKICRPLFSWFHGWLSSQCQCFQLSSTGPPAWRTLGLQKVAIKVNTKTAFPYSWSYDLWDAFFQTLGHWKLVSWIAL